MDLEECLKNTMFYLFHLVRHRLPGLHPVLHMPVRIFDYGIYACLSRELHIYAEHQAEPSVYPGVYGLVLRGSGAHLAGAVG
jgi:hypothetical protein